MDLDWSCEEHPDHDGMVIGLVPEDAGRYRELAYPRDVTRRCVALLAAGCECGWRSPHWSPSQPTEWRSWMSWGPWSVCASVEDEARAWALWRRHVERDVIGGGAANVDALPRRAKS